MLNIFTVAEVDFLFEKLSGQFKIAKLMFLFLAFMFLALSQKFNIILPIILVGVLYLRVQYLKQYAFFTMSFDAMVFVLLAESIQSILFSYTYSTLSIVCGCLIAFGSRIYLSLPKNSEHWRSVTFERPLKYRSDCIDLITFVLLAFLAGSFTLNIPDYPPAIMVLEN